jgi:hypothetical protein
VEKDAAGTKALLKSSCQDAYKKQMGLKNFAVEIKNELLFFVLFQLEVQVLETLSNKSCFTVLFRFFLLIPPARAFPFNQQLFTVCW